MGHRGANHTATDNQDIVVFSHDKSLVLIFIFTTTSLPKALRGAGPPAQTAILTTTVL
jgi:hypothetical protein